MRIINDIYAVAGRVVQSHPSDANSFLLAGEAELILIDSGSGYNSGRIFENIEQHGFKIRDISLIINTHWHFDHTGGNADFKKVSNCKTAMHRLDVETVNKSIKLNIARKFNYDLPIDTPIDIKLEGNEEFDLGKYKLQILHTPGHTPGSLCAYLTVEGEKVLFLGDAFGQLGLPGEDPEALRRTGSILLGLKPSVVLPGHGEPILSKGYEYIRAMMPPQKDF